MQVQRKRVLKKRRKSNKKCKQRNCTSCLLQSNHCSKHKLNKENDINSFNRLKSLIVGKIYKDILSRSSQSDRKGVEVKYNPFPLIIISARMVEKCISFDNTIILYKPRFEVESSFHVYYQHHPFIGCNIPKKVLSQYESGIKIRSLRKKKIALLTPRNSFVEIIKKKMKFPFVEIKK